MSNQESKESSFYAIIIAPVMRCKDLEPNAKLLYGEISGLAQKYGYCFASNSHFAEIFDVDDRTIRRWIESLEEFKFIKREQENGFGGKRKIFLCWDFQNNFTEGQKCPGGRTKMSDTIIHIITHRQTLFVWINRLLRFHHLKKLLFLLKKRKPMTKNILLNAMTFSLPQ